MTADAAEADDSGITVPQGSDNPDCGTTEFGTIRSMVNTCISAGVLALAYEMRSTGWLGVVLVLLSVATACALTMFYLFKASQLMGSITLTTTVVSSKGPRWAWVVLMVVVTDQVGTVLAYVKVLQGTLPWVMQQVFLGCTEHDAGCEVPWWMAMEVVVVVIMALVAIPTVLSTGTDSFACMSWFNIAHFAGFSVLVVYGLFYFQAEPLRVQAGPSDALAPALTAVISAFSFTAHTTALMILYGTKPAASTHKHSTAYERRILRIIVVSMLTVVAYYLIISLCIYFTFGAAVQPMALESYPDAHPLSMFVRASYTVEIATSIPIFVYELRRNLLKLALGITADDDMLARHEATHPCANNAITVLLLGACTVVGLLVPFHQVVAYTSALTTTFVAFVLPPLLLLWARKTLQTNGPTEGAHLLQSDPHHQFSPPPPHHHPLHSPIRACCRLTQHSAFIIIIAVLGAVLAVGALSYQIHIDIS